MAVTVSEVENVIEDGALTREAVTQACGAGGDCGACRTSIQLMIDDRRDLGCPRAADSAEQLVPEQQLVRRHVA